jgi:7,8-dihydropterin-6-yl-methyl-4-(beta-D-ribofuranosyl)aminobenzene 5'-phosphate synthase
MRLTVLVDNLPSGDLEAEWGLSLLLQYQGHKILLDAGASGLFAENAAKLGADLAQVELGVLSHAHADHADGWDAFFACNETAPVYLQASCREDCYDITDEGYVYAGIKQGLLGDYAPRFRRVTGPFSPLPGVTLLPHTTPGLEAKGRAGKMVRRTPSGWVPDNFDHEQSLIFETGQGLVVLNSCSHAGADVILQEAAAAFPGIPLYAMIGGFHLFDTPAEEVRAFARRLKATGVGHVITGHCTGEEGFALLREELGEQARQFSTGLVLDL